MDFKFKGVRMRSFPGYHVCDESPNTRHSSLHRPNPDQTSPGSRKLGQLKYSSQEPNKKALPKMIWLDSNNNIELKLFADFDFMDHIVLPTETLYCSIVLHNFDADRSCMIVEINNFPF